MLDTVIKNQQNYQVKSPSQITKSIIKIELSISDTLQLTISMQPLE